jgi:hypothetical protein
MLVGAAERANPYYWALPVSTTWAAPAVTVAEEALGCDAYAEAVARGRELEVGELLELTRELEEQLLAEDGEAERPGRPLPSLVDPAG